MRQAVIRPDQSISAWSWCCVGLVIGATSGYRASMGKIGEQSLVDLSSIARANICDPEAHRVGPVRAHAFVWTVSPSAQSAIGPRGLAVSARLQLPRLLPFMIPQARQQVEQAALQATAGPLQSRTQVHSEEPTVSLASTWFWWRSRRRREILCIHSARIST